MPSCHEPGPYFYRFVSLAGERADHLRDVVLANRLFQPSPISFNDPFDCRAMLSFEVSEAEWLAYFETLAKLKSFSEPEVTAEVDRMMAEKEKQGPELFATGILKSLQADVDAAGVLCFSSDATDVLLWAHYANGHRGACLRFDAHSGIFCNAQEVKYKNQCKVFKVTEVRKHELEAMEAAILTKAQGWRYEREWRLFTPGNAGKFVEFQSRELTGLILGCATSTEDQRKIRSWLAQRSTPLNSFVAHRKSQDRYELDIVPAS
jgi:hypothetical protein